MDNLVNHFVNFINSLPLWLQVIAVFGFIPVAYVLFNLVTKKDFRDDMVKMIIKRSDRRTLKDVLGHSIFGNLNRYNTLINKLKCSTIKKEYIVCYLNTRMNIFYEKLMPFVNETLTNEIELNIICREFIETIDKESETRILTNFQAILSKTYKKSTKNDELSVLIFDIVNNSYKDMDSSNKLFLNSFINTLNNNHLPYNERIFMWLNVLNVYFDVQTIEMPTLAANINGSLEKLLQ